MPDGASSTSPPLTVDTALDHAARLLLNAELETMNLQLMERLEHLADSWIAVARTIDQRE